MLAKSLLCSKLLCLKYCNNLFVKCSFVQSRCVSTVNVVYSFISEKIWDLFPRIKSTNMRRESEMPVGNKHGDYTILRSSEKHLPISFRFKMFLRQSGTSNGQHVLSTYLCFFFLAFRWIPFSLRQVSGNAYV